MFLLGANIVFYLLGLHVLQELIAGFDQEAAAAVMARLVAFKMEAEVVHDTS